MALVTNESFNDDLDEEKEEISDLKKLPPELISTILQYVEIPDIGAFSETCKYYNNMIKNSQMLWKIKLKHLLPKNIFVIVEKDCCGGNWLHQIKELYTVRQKVHSEIIAMSPKYFWQNNSITIHDVRIFFTIALSSNMNYYYTVLLLQELVINGVKNIGMWQGNIPYTMTEMHYAKVVLCHLMHSFLAVKWAQKYTKEELIPQTVLTFFLQWIDVVNLYCQDEADDEITELVRDVEMLLLPTKPKTDVPGERIKQHLATKQLTEREVIAAVARILYQHRKIVATDAMNTDTLSIPQVLKRKSGHFISLATIFQAVAHQCGINCDLIAFPRHFFLEWKCNDSERESQINKIDIATGEVNTTSRCQYSAGPQNNSCRYCPNSLLKYIIITFIKSVGPGYLGANTWYRQNAHLLLELLNPNSTFGSEYYSYFRYLTNKVPLRTLSPINIKYMTNEHLQIILSLINLNEPICKNRRCKTYKNRDHHIKFAIGMICSHKKYLYPGVIVGWNLLLYDPRRSQHPEYQNLKRGSDQPFYKFLAADGSCRYVAEENLVPVTRPQRLDQLEDIIAREFTHFNGFAYVPNKEKRWEYPEDAPISELFLSRAENKVGVSLTKPPAATT